MKSAWICDPQKTAPGQSSATVLAIYKPDPGVHSRRRRMAPQTAALPHVSSSSARAPEIILINFLTCGEGRGSKVVTDDK